MKKKTVLALAFSAFILSIPAAANAEDDLPYGCFYIFDKLLCVDIPIG